MVEHPPPVQREPFFRFEGAYHYNNDRYFIEADRYGFVCCDKINDFTVTDECIASPYTNFQRAMLFAGRGIAEHERIVNDRS